MKIKRIVALVLALMMLFTQVISVYAEETGTDEWHELVEEDFEMVTEPDPIVSPYALYLMNVITSIAKLSSTKVGMRAEVLCSAVMSKITIVFYLQKLSGTSWHNVGSTTVYAYNTSSTAKSVTASNLSSGTYRTKACVMVTASNGYAETLNGYSGSINLP
ncbi:MAG: hypothetical protein MR936_11005 [Eubacterium sp.]|nr:hypothetical protein [Eubacterium sp.]